MTEDQLVSALDALERGAQESVRNTERDHAPYAVYVSAMRAVVVRYRETNPYADTDDIEQRLDQIKSEDHA